jgi:hypothetical protein
VFSNPLDPPAGPDAPRGGRGALLAADRAVALCGVCSRRPVPALMLSVSL